MSNPFPGLQPPFSRERSLNFYSTTSSNSLPATLFPATVCDVDSFFLPHHDPKRFLELELSTPKLDKLFRHLWLAGLARPSRPLHRQKLIGRTILVTENPHEHLIWFETYIFIKPLPEFLLNFDFWQDHICSDIGLYKAARGLLLSYAWLVRHQSDLRIAKEAGLLHKNIEWSQWTLFLQDCLSHINPEILDDVSDRYQFGELRLTRLNMLYRLSGGSLDHFVRGYISYSTWYRAFFSRNFAWLLAIFATFSLLLSAMQVGLSTKTLTDSSWFHNVSYGFTVTSIVVAILSAFLISIVWLVLFCYYIRSTLLYHRRTMLKRERLREPMSSG
ncbi:hypothetical protein BGZ60DRAFT_449450 [Tricladium varicosporioides]|nr:hypothetical protein BGZ60DRAFT_449450 [Hymenoscyphus varicosporioides]